MSRKTSTNNRLQWLQYIVLALIAAFFLFMPYNRGLFFGGQFTFEKPVYIGILFGSAIILIGSITLFKKEKMDLKIVIPLGLVLLLPLIYYVASINAISPHSATDATTIAWLWAVFFTLSIILKQFLKVNTKVVVNVLMFAGYIIVFVGFLNWFGHIEMKEAILQGRLSNVFQYPNTYAVYLMGLLFGQIFIVTNDDYGSRWWRVHAFMFVPVFTSLLLTLSRGAMIIFMFMLIIHLIFSSVNKQIKSLLHISIGVVGSIFVMSLLMRFSDHEVSAFYGWISILLISILVGLLIRLVEKKEAKEDSYLTKLIHFINHRWIIPSFTIIIVGIIGALVMFQSPILKILPDTLEKRVLSIEISDSSSSQRLTYYHDSLNLVKDYPIIGTGGGGWAKLYSQYQSYPYIGNQAHSFYMQLLDETGIIGIIILGLLLIYVYFIHIKGYFGTNEKDYSQVYMLIATPILIHSVIDFHMSFVYIAAIVFFCLGGMVAKVELPTKQGSKSQIVPMYIPGILLAVISIVIIIAMGRNIEAANYYKKALKQGSYEELTKAIDIKPNHPDFVSVAIGSMLQNYKNTNDEGLLNSAFDMIQKQRKIEQYNPILMQLEAQAWIAKREPRKANQLYEGWLQSRPWDMQHHELLVNQLYELGVSNQAWWDKAIEHYLKYKELFESQKDKYDSGLLLNMDLKIAQIYYNKGSYPELITLLGKHMISSRMSLQEYRPAFRLLLAATIKEESKNEKLYKSFTDIFPEEKIEIDKLTGEH
ncbi:O-antigen ligase family protein [Cohnella cholangitidis]|uniref:O-antigen ligase family protein n=1 Tax=Cohnella cholangitidis TaxID=2598458 RepID=A0A7G5BXP0_9BACL|nr:O-antigen ligase family protein [Cohnella cholangitidis]QMV41724.1 O-antigen ligase family protein [Cohnella cholangitidis]